MIKRIFMIFLMIAAVAARAPADPPASDRMTDTTVKHPVGLTIDTGYLGTKVADPGFRYVSANSWLGSWYLEAAYNVYRRLDVFADYGYSEYVSTGNSVTTSLMTNSITIGGRYRYALWRWTVVYAELGVDSYIADIKLSASPQSVSASGFIVAPEVSAGFYIPLKVPSPSSTIGVNLQFSFGMTRNSFTRPLRLDFGSLGNIDIDGQRICAGAGMSF